MILPSPSVGRFFVDSLSVINGTSSNNSKILVPADTLDGISDKNQAVILNGHKSKKTYCVNAINSPKEISSFIDKYPPSSKTASVITIGINSNIGIKRVLSFK